MQNKEPQGPQPHWGQGAAEGGWRTLGATPRPGQGGTANKGHQRGLKAPRWAKLVCAGAPVEDKSGKQGAAEGHSPSGPGSREGHDSGLTKGDRQALQPVGSQIELGEAAQVSNLWGQGV